MNDEFHDTLIEVLQHPPTTDPGRNDPQWVADVQRAVFRRRRRRCLVAGSVATLAVTAGILVSTMVATSSDRSPGTVQHAAAPRQESTQRSSNPTTLGKVSPLAESAIVSRIMSAAAGAGDPAPTSIQYVRGTRGSLVNYAMHDQLDRKVSDAPVVLVVATGSFKVQTSGIGHPVFQGTTLSIVMNEQTGEVMDRSLSKNPVDLSHLSNVVRPAVPK